MATPLTEERTMTRKKARQLLALGGIMRVGASVQATGVEEVPSDGRRNWPRRRGHFTTKVATPTLDARMPFLLAVVARGFVARQQLSTAPRVCVERAKPASTAHTSINSRARAHAKSPSTAHVHWNKHAPRREKARQGDHP